MPGWSFAELWEVAADHVPDTPCLIHGDRVRSWAEVDQRADGIAAWLLSLGVTRQDKVAHYLYNGPEYLESMFGIFKVGLCPVNTNYRYGDDELAYLWDNADAVAVVFHGEFAERVAGLRHRVPRVRGWLWVDDGSGPCPPWATPLEDVTGSAGTRVRAPWGRDGDDVYILYTGGTTGLPKGVMWRQDDMLAFLLERGPDAPDAPAPVTLDAIRALVTAPVPRALPACPLMHGTGAFTALRALATGGSVVTLAGRHFEAAELLDAVQRHRVSVIAITGDVFARPILAELDARPGRYDLSSLLSIGSSGVMWSEAVKQGLLRHHPGMVLVDNLASSEALGMGASLSTGSGASTTAKFALGVNALVIDDDDQPVAAGSGELGRLAVRGRMPLGYYKDGDKTARTFPTIDGVRWSIPGDYAMVEADGTLRLLGRGSVCINTGGEKVFPEEVEEALKTHPGVLDAVVVGLPDERWGEAIVAVVELTPGGAEPTADQLVAHVKTQLASFKAPKRVVTIDSIGRGPNGKVDYKGLRRYALESLASA